VTLVSAVAVVLGGQSLADAAPCTVGGGSPTHASIQLAVDDPACTQVSVRPGVYPPFTINRATPVEVAGSGVETIIRPAADGSDLTGAASAIITITGATTEATVRNLTVQGPVDEGVAELTGVFVGGDATATLTQNQILNIRENTTTGLGSDEDYNAICVGFSALGEVGHATVVGNTINGYQKAGIVVDGAGSTAAVLRNTVAGSVRTDPDHPVPYGIQVSRGALAEVTGNKVSNNSHTTGAALSVGILLFEAANKVEVIGNTAKGNDTGICVKQTNEATLERNRALDSLFDGISLDNQDSAKTTDGHTVRRNKAIGNGEGITVFSSHGNLFERNVSKNNNGAGFLVSCDDAGSGCTNPHSSNNQFKKNKAINNGIEGYLDESSGVGTAGTANFYMANKCSGNDVEGSNPDGLCLPQQP
jgi:parallel beta-helix repeat protein